MKTKRLFAVVAAIVAFCLVIAGCGGNTTTETGLNIDKSEYSETNGLKLPISEDGEVIEVMAPSSVEGLDKKVFAQAVKELTGIEIKYSLVASSNYSQKLKMLLSSKQLPDVFASSLGRAELEMLAKNNAIVNFTEMGDKLPNISEMYLNNPENLELAGDMVVDGDLYVVPGYNIARDINHSFMYRKDIFDKHGIEPWTNTEEFYQALKKLKEIYPESMPFTGKLKLGLIARLAPGWGMNGVDITKIKGEGDYVYAGTHENMKELLDFLNKLYSEGLLDQEFLTCTEASWASKMTQNDKSFVTFDWVDRMDMFYEQVKADIPDFNLTCGNPIGPEGKYARLSKVGSATLAASNNKNAETSAKLIDFLMSPAGAKLATLGVNGITYDEVDGKVEYKLPEGVQPSIKSLEEEYGLFTGSVALRFDPTCVYYQFTPQVENAQKLVIENNLLTEKAAVPVIIKSELSDEYGKLLNEIKTKFEEFASKYIVGDPSTCDEMWKNWVAQAESLGVARLVEIANTK